MSRNFDRLKKNASSFSSNSKCDINIDMSGSVEVMRNPEVLIPILEQLIQQLLHLRFQIPQTYHQVQEKLKKGDQEKECEIVDPKMRRAKLKQIQDRKKYVARASAFSRSYTNFLDKLSEEIRSTLNEIDTISFMFGATPVTPRECYSIKLPPPPVTGASKSHRELFPCSEKESRRMSLHLFRSIVTHESLFTMLGKPLLPTNFFVALRKTKSEKGLISSPWFLPRQGFGKNLRCHKIQFNFNAVNKKEPQIRNPRKRSAPSFSNYDYETESGIPMPMELCTPIHGVEQQNCSQFLFDTPRMDEAQMIETPCVSSCAHIKMEPTDATEDAFTFSEMNCHLPPDESSHIWLVSRLSIKGFKDPEIKLKCQPI